MFDLLQKGGMFMYFILAVSVLALALFCERASFLFIQLKLNHDSVLQKIIFLLEKMNYHGAIEECSRIEKHPLGRILKAGLLKSDKKDKEIERALEENIMREIPRIKTRINYLALFANISTLLGLLGTIQGLIIAFQGVSTASAAMKQEILANGISIAMLTTAFGLIVAIPCLIAYYILNNRGNYLVDQFEEKAYRLFNVLCSLKKDKEAVSTSCN
ncbi:MAG: MotA/TolQ/ExbB proton channel family protein [bacterium]